MIVVQISEEKSLSWGENFPPSFCLATPASLHVVPLRLILRYDYENNPRPGTVKFAQLEHAVLQPRILPRWEDARLP